MNRRSRAFLLMGAFAALSACGLRGGLERPDPLFGEPDPEDLEAAKPIEDTGETSAVDPSVLDGEDELLGGPEGD